MEPPVTPRDRVQRYSHVGKRTSEWFWYARAYFDAARHLANAYDADQTQHYLIIPLIFNLRHALELLLKFLAYGTGAVEAINIHDLHEIFSGVGGALSNLDQRSVSEAAAAFGVERDLIAKYLQIMTEKVEQATAKYYAYGFLTQDQKPIDDPNNVLFRYPSTTSEKGAFNPEELTKRVPAADILQDIELLSNFAWSIYLMFGKNEEDGLHILKHLEVKEAAAARSKSRNA